MVVTGTESLALFAFTRNLLRTLSGVLDTSTLSNGKEASMMGGSLIVIRCV